MVQSSAELQGTQLSQVGADAFSSRTVNIGPGVDEAACNGEGAIEIGEVQESETSSKLGIYIGLVIQQPQRRPPLAHRVGIIQRRQASGVFSIDVDRVTTLKQELHNIETAMSSRRVDDMGFPSGHVESTGSALPEKHHYHLLLLMT